MNDALPGLATPGSRALLIGTAGTADPDELPPVDAVHRTLADLREALLTHCGLHPERLDVVVDPTDPAALARAVARAARATTDTLFLHYVGHGLVGPRNELRLCTRSTTGAQDELRFTTVSFADLLDVIRPHRPDRLVAVLDCCHAERAADEPVTGLRHHYLLPAAARDQAALAPPGRAHTTFSGALIDLLNDGVTGAPHLLTLEDVQHALTGRGMSPRARLDSTSASFPLARNTAPTVTPREVRANRDSGTCPYPGLAAFDETNHRWFHGRQGLVDDLLHTVTRPPHPDLPLMLLGVSGVGKSSLLRAGLLPALRRSSPDAERPARTWTTVLVTPTGRPLRVLANALAPLTGADGPALQRQLTTAPTRVARALHRPGTAVLICVDQFEEVFTLCDDEAERTAFLRALTTLAGPAAAPGPVSGSTTGPRTTLRVLLCVSALYYAQCAERPELTRALSHQQTVVPPLDAAGIRAAVLDPAHQENLRVEDGLLELVLADLGHDRNGWHGPDPDTGPPRPAQGALGSTVHLAQALAATWQRREHGTLTVRGYRATGGIVGVLTATADAVFADLTPDERILSRHLLLRTVRPGRPLEGVPPTRQPVDRHALVRELCGPDPQRRATADALVDRFLRAGLLVPSGDLVQPAHDTLLRDWHLMRGWLADDPHWRLRHGQVRAATEAWRVSGERADDLYRGHTLAEALDLVRDRPRLDVGEDVARFLDASVRSERHGARRHRLRGRLGPVLAVATAGSLVAAVVLGTTGTRAQRDATAERETRQARDQARAAMDLRDLEPAHAARLALAARHRGGDEAWSALISLSRGPHPLPQAATAATRLPAVTAASFAPREPLVALVTGGRVRLWSTVTGRGIGTLTPRGDRRTPLDVAHSGDGRRVVVLTTGPGGAEAHVWDATSVEGQPAHVLAVRPSPGETWRVSLSKDGSTVAVTSEEATELLPVTPAGERRILDGESLAYVAGGTLLAGLDRDRRPTVRQGTRSAVPLPGATGKYVGLPAVAPDGTALAARRADGTVDRWQLDSPTVLRMDPLTSTATTGLLEFSGDSRFLAVSEGNGRVALWDARVPARPTLTTVHEWRSTPKLLLFGPPSAPGHPALFVSDGVTSGLWSALPLRQPAARTELPVPGPVASALSPDGTLVAVGTHEGAVRIRAAAGAAEPVDLGGGTGSPVTDLAFLHDGRTVMVVRGKGVELWDAEDGAASRPLATLPGVRAAPAAGAARLLVSTPERRVVLWDTDRPTNPRRIMDVAAAPPLPTEPVALSVDGTLAYAGKWWDLTHPTPRAVSGTPTTAARAVPLASAAPKPAADQQRLVTGGDTTLLVGASNAAEDVRKSEGRERDVTAPGTTVTAAALTPDGSLLALGDARGSVRLARRTATGDWHTITTLPAREGAITALALTSKADLAVAAADGTVLVSALAPDHLATALCSRLRTQTPPAASDLPEVAGPSNEQLCGDD
ncbi:hypothetical protein [Streptomyces sp. NPDC048057]|uniref:caspase, EACC1-associated type n=1 Tax=Streptomyces sp. NPDC048057 TaxID=3155628 RepID=UPI0033FDEF58